MNANFWKHVLVLGLLGIQDNAKYTTFVVALEVVYPVVSPDIGPIGISNVEDILKYAIDLKMYGLQPENINSFTFEVKSCRDTAVYLTNSLIFDCSSPLYVIYLGGSDNKWSAIRKKIGTKKFIKRIYGSHLQCSEYITFWISWSQGLIKFGNGSVVDENILDEWQDSTPVDVNGIGISTGYGGGGGEWMIPVNVTDNFDGFFINCQRSNLRVNSFIVLTTLIRKTGCGLVCGKDSACIGFNYSESLQRCELISPSRETLTYIPTEDSFGWDINFKCFNKTGVCIGCLFLE